MEWSQSAVTNDGVALLKEVLAGKILAITGAAGGTGTAPAAALMAQTALVNQKQVLSLLPPIDTGGGKKLHVQITSKNLAAGYLLNQVGVWATIDGRPPVLFAIIQDETGISVPSATEIPEFLLEFFLLVEFSQYADLVVRVDPSASVSMSTMLRHLEAKEDCISKASEKEYAGSEDFMVLSDWGTTKRISFENFTATLKTHLDPVYGGEIARVEGKFDQSIAEVLSALSTKAGVMVGGAEPASGPVLWFDTSVTQPGLMMAMLELGAEGDAQITVEVDESVAPVENASVNHSPQAGTYNFDIL